MVVSLYTVRIVLRALGAEDYGIYNVVAGVVTMLSFLSQTMSSSTQRFYSYELGREGMQKLYDVFSISMNMYLIISVAILIIGETLGLWFVNTELVIPAERMVTANWIYQFSLISFVATILAVPYSAAIIAHEDMSVYAVISISDCLLKLGGALAVRFVSFDKLFAYGLAMMAIACFTSVFYTLFARHRYSECRYRRVRDNSLFKTLASFWGWNLFGSFAGVANNQGNNILINIFFGPVVNAARSIAFSISNAVSAFCNNFYMAIRPPLVKSYASGEHAYMMLLFYFSNKFVYYLLLIICLPLILEMHFILEVWLSEVTEYMVVFSQLAIVYTFIAALEHPITTLVHATGKNKKYSIYVESVILLSLPLSYVAFKLGAGPVSTFWITILIFAVAHIVRLLVLKSLIRFSIIEYSRIFLIPALFVTLLSAVVPVVLKTWVLEVSGFEEFMIITLVSLLMSVVWIYVIGINKKERQMLSNFLHLKRKR